MANTTIHLRDDTKARLEERGSKGDTYDDIVRELLYRVEELETDEEP